jgi:hypothetical protein
MLASIIVALTHAAGPLVCCCVVSMLPKPAKAELAAPAPVVTCCSGHCHETPAASPDTTPDPAPAPKSCPCEDRIRTAVLAVLPLAEPVDDAPTEWFTLELRPVFALCDCAVNVPDVPRRTAETQICVHHVMRC